MAKPKKSTPAQLLSDERKRSWRVYDLYKKESDRAAAVLAASYVDSLLKDALAGRLGADKQVQKDVLEGRGALGNFSSRIDLAYLLGMISTVRHRDLHIVRRIRNDLSHTFEDMAFDTASVKARCLELSAARQIITLDQTLKHDYFTGSPIRFIYMLTINDTLWDIEPFAEGRHRILLREDVARTYPFGGLAPDGTGRSVDRDGNVR